MMSPTILQMNPSSRIFGLANINPMYGTFDADYHTILILGGSSSSTWLTSIFILYCFGRGSLVILWLRVYTGPTSVNYVSNTAWHHLPEWNSKPHVRWSKRRHKTNHGAGKFSQKLHNSKESSYSEHNSKSGRYNRQHTFIHHKPWKIHQDTNTTCLPNKDLKVKTRNNKETKFSPPCRRDRMICAIDCHQFAGHLESIEVSQHILPYDELDLYNDYISKEPDYINLFSINFPCHCVLGHVLSDSDPLNDLGPWKEGVRPTKKPRSVGPHKTKPKKTTSKKKTRQKNKKSRSVTL